MLEQLRGPAPAWPAPADVVAEGWARLPGRARALLVGAGALVLVVAAAGGLLEGPWGPPVEVLVARDDVAPGAALTGDLVATVERPGDTLPAGALRPGGLPARAVATGHVPRGAVVTAGHVVAGGRSAVVPAGRGLVPAPTELLPPLPPGTHVRVVAATTDGAALTVAARATVAAVDATHVWLEVDDVEVAGVAAAVARGAVVIGVVP